MRVDNHKILASLLTAAITTHLNQTPLMAANLIGCVLDILIGGETHTRRGSCCANKTAENILSIDIDIPDCFSGDILPSDDSECKDHGKW